MHKLSIRRTVGVYEVLVEGTSEDFPTMLKELDSAAHKLAAIYEQSPEQDEVPLVANMYKPTEGIIRLFETQWGNKPRTMKEIKEALEKNGMYYPTTTLSSILIGLWKNDKLRRWKTEAGYVYHKRSR